MSDTPLTDAEVPLVDITCDDSCVAIYVQKNGEDCSVVDAEFARELERKVAQLEKQLEGYRADNESWA